MAFDLGFDDVEAIRKLERWLVMAYEAGVRDERTAVALAQNYSQANGNAQQSLLGSRQGETVA